MGGTYQYTARKSSGTNGNFTTSSSMPSFVVPQHFTSGAELNTPFTAHDDELVIYCLYRVDHMRGPYRIPELTRPLKGVQGWFLDNLDVLYGSVPVAVKTKGPLPESFECVMEFKQECPLCPISFGLYYSIIRSGAGL